MRSSQGLIVVLVLAVLGGLAFYLVFASSKKIFD